MTQTAHVAAAISAVYVSVTTLDHLVHSAMDELTGVASRHGALNALQLRVAQEVAQYCFVIDIDNFEVLNANLGIETGDAILVRAAEFLTELLPDFALGRLAGDQFIAFGERRPTDLERTTLTAFEFATATGAHTIQLSAGLSSSDVSGLETDGLLRDAFGALREAKAAGKQRVVVANHELRLAEVGRRRVATEARDALENNELQAWAQPIYDLSTNRPAGFELLARWPRDDEFASPGLFVPIIESLGFSFLLGEFMVREAMDLLARLRDDGHDDVFVTLNISAEHISEPLLPSLIAVQLEHRGIPPERLIVELTESQRLPSSRSGRNAIDRLRSVGIGVASDDLGAGWSSLTQMIGSRFTHIKTDRALIQATAEPGGRELIEAIRLLAEGANQIAIAEGIETEVELRAVRAAGFQLGQGWFLSRPAPIEAALVLLDD